MPKKITMQLILAANNGQIDAVRVLLATDGIDVNYTGQHGETALISAAENGHIEVVRVLLNAGGIEVNRTNQYDDTALIWSASNGHTKIVELLLAAQGIKVNHTGQHGYTALILAVKNGQTDAVRVLLNADGIDANGASQYGNTALIVATHNGHTKIIELLLAAQGIKVNHTRQNGVTALILAAKNGQTDVVRVLLNADGIDANGASEYGDTALIWAANRGHIEIVELLLAAPGIEVNLANRHGNTALIVAAINGHTEVIQALVAAGGINVNCVGQYGNTALIVAVKNGQTEVVQTLVSADGIEVNRASKCDDTALLLAAYKGHIEVVRVLLNADGIEVNRASKCDDTALLLAAYKGHIEVVRVLLNAGGIEVNGTNQNGYTALLLAAHSGHIEVVRVLLNADGIKVNHAGQNGNTALLLAAHSGHIEVVRVLLNADGIKVNYAGQHGSTALIVAASNGHAKIVERLMCRGANVCLKTVKGYTAIEIAAHCGHISVLKVFSDFGVPLDDDRLLFKRKEDGSIETLAQTAAWNQKPEVIDFLIKANINIHRVFPPIGYWVNNRDGYAFDNDSRQTLVALLSDVSPMGRFNGNDARTQLFKDIEAFRERVFLLSSWFRPYVWQHASDPEAKRFDILMNLFVQTPCSVVMIKEGLSLPEFFNVSFVGALLGRHTELIKEDYEERILDTIVAGCLQRYRDQLDINGLLWCTKHKDAWRAKRHHLKSWLREVQNGVNFESNGPAADASGQPEAKRQRVDAGASVSADFKRVTEVLAKALNASTSTPGHRQEAVDLLFAKAHYFEPGQLAAIINIGDSRWSASKSRRRIPNEMYAKTRLPDPSGPRFFAPSQHEQLVTFFRNEGLGRPDDLPVEVQGEMLKRFSYNPDGL